MRRDDHDWADHLLAVALAAFIVFGGYGLLWIMNTADTVYWQDEVKSHASR